MGANDYQMNYNVDMVFCIDTTGSMYPVLNMVKQNALNFYNDVTKVMTEKAKKIHQLRVRVVAYRDYLADGNTAMRVTDFFNLPEQSAEFEQCVRSLEADGGGDEPEDGLEALALIAQHSARIAAVLLDVVMPRMDGFQLLEVLRRIWQKISRSLRIGGETVRCRE